MVAGIILPSAALRSRGAHTSRPGAARAASSAAVSPARPDPMTTSRRPPTGAAGVSALVLPGLPIVSGPRSGGEQGRGGRTGHGCGLPGGERARAPWGEGSRRVAMLQRTADGQVLA
jgi:hypothetical protein